MAKGAYFPGEILQSKAYLSLKGIAAQVLGLFMLKRQFEKIPAPKQEKQKRKCINGQSLSLTYIEAEKEYGITQPRLTRAIDDLLAKGFLTCTYQGGTCKQDKSTYSLIDRYLLWRSGTVFEKRKFDPVERGFRKPKRDGRQKKEHTDTLLIHSCENVCERVSFSHTSALPKKIGSKSVQSRTSSQFRANS